MCVCTCVCGEGTDALRLGRGRRWRLSQLLSTLFSMQCFSPNLALIDILLGEQALCIILPAFLELGLQVHTGVQAFVACALETQQTLLLLQQSPR